MAHVLGLGASTPWDDVLVGAGEADPYWPGAAAVARYDSAGGSATNKVPVAITVGAMEDMGYEVDMADADSYTVSASLRVFGAVFQLRELPMPKPGLVTPDGRIVRPAIRLR